MSELARRSDVFEDQALGLALRLPGGLGGVARAATEDDGVIVRGRPAVGRRAAGVRHAVHLRVHAGGQPRSCPRRRRRLLGQVRQHDRAEAQDRRPAADRRRARADPLLGVPRETIALDATVDGEAGGVLEVALDVDRRGRAIGVGFTASAADRARTAEAFSRLAGSIVLR